jgi:hypothetical protein
MENNAPAYLAAYQLMAGGEDDDIVPAHLSSKPTRSITSLNHHFLINLPYCPKSKIRECHTPFIVVTCTASLNSLGGHRGHPAGQGVGFAGFSRIPVGVDGIASLRAGRTGHETRVPAVHRRSGRVSEGEAGRMMMTMMMMIMIMIMMIMMMMITTTYSSRFLSEWTGLHPCAQAARAMKLESLQFTADLDAYLRVRPGGG